MAKAVKEVNQVKGATIFDFVDGVTHKKKEWSKWSESDQKKFSPFIVNRWLSMNMDFIDIVNELQRYTIGQVSPAETYKLYFDILPKQKQFNKYIKGTKSDKYNQNLVELLSQHFLVSEKEAKEYIDIYLDTNVEELKSIIKKYGKTDKEVAALMKSEKTK